MKKLFAILMIMSITVLANAQQAVARFHNDHTSSNMVFIDLAPTLNNVDTIRPNASVTFYKFVAITHAKTLDATVASARKWDEVVLDFTCDTLTAGRVVTFGTHFKTTTSGATMTVKKSKSAIICFRFDGVAWMEESRSIVY